MVNFMGVLLERPRSRRKKARNVGKGFGLSFLGVHVCNRLNRYMPQGSKSKRRPLVAGKPVSLNFAAFILSTSTLCHPIHGLEVIVCLAPIDQYLWYLHPWSLKFDMDTQKQRKLFERTSIPSFSASPCIKFPRCINGCFPKKRTSKRGSICSGAQVFGWRASSASTAFAAANPVALEWNFLSQAIEVWWEQQKWSKVLEEKIISKRTAFD